MVEELNGFFPSAKMSEAEIDREIQRVRQDETLNAVEKGDKLNVLYRNKVHRFGNATKKNTFEKRQGEKT